MGTAIQPMIQEDAMPASGILCLGIFIIAIVIVVAACLVMSGDIAQYEEDTKGIRRS